jgi:beta-galactosidase
MKPDFTRREFLRTCALSTAAVASGALVSRASETSAGAAVRSGPARQFFPLNQNWRFGGKFTAEALKPGFDDTAFSKITLPHCVSKLSWQGWRPAEWQEVWIYRRHFTPPKEFTNRRIFLDFDGVMNTATPAINGQTLPLHAGGYLPFYYEITRWLKPGDNVLSVAVDSRWNNVPPDGHPQGAPKVDYLEPGGIVRPVALRAVPQIFISDVFAKPVDVLNSNRRVEVTCTIDAAMVPQKPLQIRMDMMDGERRVASVSKALNLEQVGESVVALTLSDLDNVKLWDVEAPQLYQVVATLLLDGESLHDYRTRIGLREARFDVDGFFLNGKRLRLFGLDRHEIYPYVGFAMPPRVMRRDAEILRHEFNCNAVRCSHYPQNEAFLDACDELGLMVWQEPPGWQYLGDDAWKELAVRDVQEMIRRDRNHPSIIIWGVRVNESRNDAELYQRTTAAAKALDDSRPASGSMTPDGRKTWQQDWHEDVFAFDDYHSAPDGSVGIDAPLPGVPYLLAEAVGQYSYGTKGFNNKYRRAGEVTLQTQQAGVIAWCAFDYSSLMNCYNAVKCPGVADSFRIPKLGATFYQAQISPNVRPVILPNFFWDFGAHTPHGPGQRAAIFSNCDRLDVFVAGKPVASVRPDRVNFPHLAYPPFFCDLEIAEGVAQTKPELRINGYVGSRLALSKSFSSDPGKDQFIFAADDAELVGDGTDATRLVFKIVDQYGSERAFAGGEITFALTGPGELVGDNPYVSLAESGGVGAVWIRTVANTAGQIVVKAAHATLGEKTATIRVTAASTWEKS